MECEWIRTSECDLARLRTASKGVAVLPLASIESHGPHLPTGSDPLCLQNLLERVAAEETVAVLPVLPYSNVAQMRARLGAVHIQSDVLMDLVENICEEAYRNGFGKIVLLHGHGGNEVLLRAFVTRMLEREKPYTVYAVPVLCTKSEEVRALLQSPCGHACEMETSMNLAAVPELVHLERLGKRTFPTLPGSDVGDAIIPAGWIARHPQAVVGEPRLASREKGEKIMADWADAVVEVLRKIKRDKATPAFLKKFALQTNSLRREKTTRTKKGTATRKRKLTMGELHS